MIVNETITAIVAVLMMSAMGFVGSGITDTLAGDDVDEAKRSVNNLAYLYTRLQHAIESGNQTLIDFYMDAIKESNRSE